MSNLYNHLTQEEYSKITHEFLEESGLLHNRLPVFNQERHYFFYSVIQNRLIEALTTKFANLGYKLERAGNDPKTQAILYRAVDQDGKVCAIWDGYSTVMNNLKYVDQSRYGNMPDVKIVMPDYREERLQQETDKVVSDFVEMNKKATGSPTINPNHIT